MPFYNASNQPNNIQDEARNAMLVLSIKEGYLTKDGRKVVPYDAENELPPSVARVVKWLDENIDGHLTAECARQMKFPHKLQLEIAVRDLEDHGLVEVVVDNGVKVFYLTDEGDEMAEDIQEMKLAEIEMTDNSVETIGGLFG